MKGLRWYVLAILVLGSAIAYVLRTNFNIVSETMMRDLGLNEYQLGMVFSAFAAGYAIFQFPGGIFGDKFGPRFTITIIAVAWTALTVLTAVIPGNDALSVATIVVALIVTRFLVGAFHAPFFPVTIGGTITSWFPLKQWGLANGLTSTGLTLGAAATAPLIVWLMDTYGWRSALLMTAPVGLLFAFLFHRYVTDDPKDHPQITDKELDRIASDRPTAGHVAEKGAWLVALKNRNVLLITSSYFCMNYLFYLFFSWFFFYLTDIKGMSNTDAGMFVSAQWILGAVGATAGGVLCDILVRRLGVRSGPRILTMTALILSAAFLYIGAVSGNPVLSVVFLCLSFACNQMTEAPIWVATMAVSGRHAPVATGILNTGANVPGVLGGLLVPVTAGLFGWPAAMATGSIFAIIGALLWLFIRADEPMSD
ncbi:MAG: MFS transporter [Gammaproteobacteria bacterium]|nr:MFS transporter [Gammaproteobacteria bacterium]MDH5261838.1 MFS transporter [Gammaproteobacteria bacterium]MDH5582412.1 MFS transporter [Gammaproteobacteria bacterium]